MTGYELSRRWFDFCFENKEAKTQHTALFFWVCELNNRLAWKDEFGLPTQDTMEVLSIGNKSTYLSALRDLERWGFVRIVKEAKNQYQSCIISVCRVNNATALHTALHTALDTAMIRHSTQHSNGIGYGIGVSIDTIDKQENKETIKQKNNETINNSSANADSNIESEVSVFDSIDASELKTTYTEAKKEKPPVAKPPQQFDIRKHAPTKEFFEANGFNMPEQIIGDGRLQFLVMDWHWNQTPEKQAAAANVYETFLNYWTAKVQNGKRAEIGKELWETKPTFDIGGRVATFLKNNSNSNYKSNGNSKANIGTVEQGKSGNTLQSFNPEEVGRAFQDAGFKVVSRETVSGHS